MTKALDFNRDGQNWPHRAHSRFIKVHDITFHVQMMGEGAPIVLLHGTGASTHSWRDVMPLLAKNHLVIALDLPGHGFTRDAKRSDLSLSGMARAIGALLRIMKIAPQSLVGHSAGAVIALELVDQHYVTPEKIVSFNGAFLPIAGPVGQFFSPLAKLIASFGFLNGIFARLVDRRSVENLLSSTGSHLDAAGIGLYETLFTNEAHISGTLTMMAEWDLSSVKQALARLKIPLILIKATKDKTIPPETADDVARMTPHARIVTLKGLGHLAHEENPVLAASAIMDPSAVPNVSEPYPPSARRSA